MTRDVPELLFNGPSEAPATFAFAHGAGAPMDHSFMNTVAEHVAQAGIRIARFEFAYMQARRLSGGRRPPDRAPVLTEAWMTVIETLGGGERLVIGGKSMGGRIASLIADEVKAKGLICLGYPFHPLGKPDRLRVEHLADLTTPTLILQGERDRFGSRDEVEGYDLSPAIAVSWLPDGDHSFKPRKASGVTEADNLRAAVEMIVAFIRRRHAENQLAETLGG